MEILTVKIEEIKPYENNPRLHDENLSGIIESIKEFGYISPIVVDEKNVILAGQGRYEAIKLLKGKLNEIIKTAKGSKKATLEKINNGLVDVIKVYGLTEEQKKEYRIVDNRLLELSKWDYGKLLTEIETINKIPIGFSVSEIEKLREEFLMEMSKIDTKKEKDIAKEIVEENIGENELEVICPECGFKFKVHF